MAPSYISAIESLQGQRVFWLVLGNVVLVFGGSVAAVYSFQGRFLFVVAGFMSFAVGYRFAQIGKYSSQQNGSRSLSYQINRLTFQLVRTILLRITFVIVGVVIISAGGFIGAQAILDPSMSQMIISGILMVSGFVISHTAVNNTLV